MYRILSFVALVLGLNLIGCGQYGPDNDTAVDTDTQSCPTGFHTVDDLCVQDTQSCPAGYHPLGNLCVEDDDTDVTPVECVNIDGDFEVDGVTQRCDDMDWVVPDPNSDYLYIARQQLASLDTQTVTQYLVGWGLGGEMSENDWCRTLLAVEYYDALAPQPDWKSELAGGGFVRVYLPSHVGMMWVNTRGITDTDVAWYEYANECPNDGGLDSWGNLNGLVGHDPAACGNDDDEGRVALFLGHTSGHTFNYYDAPDQFGHHCDDVPVSPDDPSNTGTEYKITVTPVDELQSYVEYYLANVTTNDWSQSYGQGSAGWGSGTVDLYIRGERGQIVDLQGEDWYNHFCGEAGGDVNCSIKINDTTTLSNTGNVATGIVVEAAHNHLQFQLP